MLKSWKEALIQVENKEYMVRKEKDRYKGKAIVLEPCRKIRDTWLGDQTWGHRRPVTRATGPRETPQIPLARIPAKEEQEKVGRNMEKPKEYVVVENVMMMKETPLTEELGGAA